MKKVKILVKLKNGTTKILSMKGVGHLGHPQLKKLHNPETNEDINKNLITMKDLRSMKFYQTCYYLKKSEKE